MNVSNGLLFVILGFFLVAPPAYGSLKERLQTELTNQNTPMPALASYQIIFIDGFLGDQINTNFFPSASVLHKWAISDAILIHPITVNPIEMNSEILFKQITDIRRHSQKPKALVVVYSKAGPELLLAILHHPELIIENYISQLVIVDGALRGTPLADLWSFVCGNKRPSKMQFREDSALCKKAASFGPTLVALQPSHIVPIIEEAMDTLTPELKKEIASHLYTVRSKMMGLRQDSASKLFLPHLYLQKFFGDNDGVILASGQKLPKGMGEDLGLFDVDHFGLLMGTDSKSEELFREAFMRSLIGEVLSRQTLK